MLVITWIRRVSSSINVIEESMDASRQQIALQVILPWSCASIRSATRENQLVLRYSTTNNKQQASISYVEYQSTKQACPLSTNENKTAMANGTLSFQAGQVSRRHDKSKQSWMDEFYCAITNQSWWLNSERWHNWHEKQKICYLPLQGRNTRCCI